MEVMSWECRSVFRTGSLDSTIKVNYCLPSISIFLLSYYFCSLDLKENTAVKWYVFMQDISNMSSRDIRMAKNKAQSVSYDFLVEMIDIKEFVCLI